MKRTIFRFIVFLVILFALDRGVAAFFTKGLETYYGLDQEADILLIEHSHMMKSCDKEKMEQELGVKVSKYCREGVMVRDRYAMIQHFLSTQKDNSVPYVLYGIDPFMFREGDLSLNSHKLFYPFMGVDCIDELIREKSTEWHEYPVHKYIHCTRLTDNMLYRSVRGWAKYWTSFQNGRITDADWKSPHPWEVYIDKEAEEIFLKTIDLLLKHNCHIVLVHPPIIDSYRSSNPEAFEYMMNYYKRLADSNPNIDILDYGPLLSNKQEIFEDPVHVNLTGCKLMTEALIQDMRKIMSKESSPHK